MTRQNRWSISVCSILLLLFGTAAVLHMNKVLNADKLVVLNVDLDRIPQEKLKERVSLVAPRFLSPDEIERLRDLLHP